MTTEFELSEKTAEKVVENLESEKDSIENTLQSFRGNDLTHLESYQHLLDELDEVIESKVEIEEQLNSSENEDEGLGELFG